MRYVVGYVDQVSGITKFRSYDYKNDAIEFIEIHKEKGLWVQLYEATELKKSTFKQSSKKDSVILVNCPVCKMDTNLLLNSGWCKKCQERME